MDRCVAYLRDVGLEPHEDPPPLPGDQAGNVICRIPATPGETRRADPALRARRHRRADGCDRAGRSERHRHEHARHHPRRRQQGRRRGDARGRAPDRRGGPSRTPASSCAQRPGGDRPARRQGASTARSSQARFGYVYDHAAPIGELVTACPSQYSIDATFLGRSAHAGMVPEDGPQRDRRGRPRPRRDALRPARRRDDRQRRHDLRAASRATSSPDRCVVRLEVRSRDHERALKESQVNARRARVRGQRRRVRARDRPSRRSTARTSSGAADPVVQIAWGALECVRICARPARDGWRRRRARLQRQRASRASNMATAWT